MTPPPSGLANAAGSPRRETAASSICQISPTRCQARTRLYRDGKLELEGFPVDDISDYLADGSVAIWLDLRGPDHDDLAVLSAEFGLHPLAVEAALRPSQRPKLDRYRTHLLLTAYGARLDTGTGELTTSEIAAFSLAWPRLPAAAEVAIVAAGYFGYALVRLAVRAGRPRSRTRPGCGGPSGGCTWTSNRRSTIWPRLAQCSRRRPDTTTGWRTSSSPRWCWPGCGCAGRPRSGRCARRWCWPPPRRTWCSGPGRPPRPGSPCRA